jgi:hypothetical protein
MGGWAKNSSVTEGKYIDPTMTPTRAAWRFFPATLILAVQAFGFKLLAKRALGKMVIYI